MTIFWSIGQSRLRGLVNLLKAGKGGDRCIRGVYLHRPPTRYVDTLQEGGFWYKRGLCKVFFYGIYEEFFFFYCGFVFNVGCFSGNWVGRISGKEDREQGQGDNIKGLVWGVLRIV